jgi:hypothetical protein
MMISADDYIIVLQVVVVRISANAAAVIFD